jgi:hypothetical protein
MGLIYILGDFLQTVLVTLQVTLYVCMAELRSTKTQDEWKKE